MRTDRPDEVSRVRQTVAIADPFDPTPSEASRPEATRLGVPILIGVTWIPLGWWTSVLLAKHVFALLGCASPNPPEPVTTTESTVAALATALLTVSSLAACRRQEDPWPRTEWPFILAAIVTGAVSSLSALLAIVLATDVSLPNSPGESIPEGVVAIAIFLQSLMTVLIGSVTALRLLTWRSTMRRRLSAATVLLVLLGAALMGLSDMANRLLCT